MLNVQTFLVFFVLTTPLYSVLAQTWTPQNSGNENQLYEATFVNDSIGWIVGAGELQNGNTILHTTNAGSTWTPQTTATVWELEDVVFLNADTGWAVGGAGAIRHTTNGGATWTSQNSGTSYNFHEVFFVNADNGCVAGDDAGYGKILRTTNGGNSWTPQWGGSITQLLEDVMFVDSVNGWAVGWSGTILRTRNGGESWTPQNSQTNADLWDAAFTDTSNGWVVGAGVILRTTNGGASWSSQSPGPNYLFSITFLDMLNGWICGEGLILRTTNAGDNWTVQDDETVVLYSITFTDPDHGWVVGSLGTILHYVDSTQTSITPPCEGLAGEYELEQNYPNPFNNTTQLTFDLPHSGHVQLTVTDVLGRTVATLADGSFAAGSHYLNFDAGKLPSGVYVATLRSGSVTTSQKLVLLK